MRQLIVAVMSIFIGYLLWEILGVLRSILDILVLIVAPLLGLSVEPSHLTIVT